MRHSIVALALALCWAQADWGEQVVLTGKVVNQAGQPVAGARVWTWYRDRGRGCTVDAVSDERGGFRLKLETDAARYLSVLAVAPGLAVGKAVFGAEDAKPLLFRLPAEAKIRGVVRNDRGEPVAGAQVILRSFTPAGARRDDFEALVFFAPECPIRTAADAQGRFEIGSVPDGAGAELMVEADGFARWTPWTLGEAPNATAGQAADYEITLQQAAVIEGTATRDGQPAAGVRVTAEAVGAGNGWDEAVSDEEGHYRLARLGQGTYNVLLDETTDFVAAAHEGITVAPGEKVEGIDLKVSAGGIIEGRVVDADTGAPVPKAYVASYGPARPRSGGACISVIADENGAYDMRVAAGSNWVYYQGGSAEYPYAGDVSFDIDVPEGQTVQAPDLKPKRAEPIVVRVVDAQGRPVPEATVEWHREMKQSAKADAQGQCEVPGIRAGVPVVFVARDPGDQLCGATVVAGVDPKQPVTVCVQPAASIQLRLVDMEGKPLAGIETSAFLSAEVDAADAATIWDRQVTVVIASAESTEEGLVRFEGLPAGIAPTFGTRERTANNVQWPTCPALRAGAEYDLGEVALDLRRMAVRGTVILPDGTPVTGAFVTVIQWGAPTVRTDGEGGFEIGDLLPSEEVVLVGASPDRKLFGAEKVVPEWELEPALVLTAPVGVKGLLAGRDGTPLADRKVQLQPATGGRTEGFPLSRETKTDQDGAFAFEPVVAGAEYDLLAADAEGRLARIVLTFVAEPGAEVDLGPITTAGE